jgi:hypothetical protein
MTRRASMLAAVALALVAGAASAAPVDRERINKGVDAKMADLQHCYDIAVARDPNLPKGRIVTVFVVETDGKVSNAEIKRNDMKDERLGHCVRDVFLSLEYAPMAERATINYPLLFE